MSQESFIPETQSAPEVSSKSTKNEIFEAYQNLLNKVKGTKQESHQAAGSGRQKIAAARAVRNIIKWLRYTLPSMTAE